MSGTERSTTCSSLVATSWVSAVSRCRADEPCTRRRGPSALHRRMSVTRRPRATATNSVGAGWRAVEDMLGRLVAVDGSLHKAPYGGEGTGPNPTESRHAGFEVHSRDVLVLFNP